MLISAISAAHPNARAVILTLTLNEVKRKGKNPRICPGTISIAAARVSTLFVIPEGNLRLSLQAPASARLPTTAIIPPISPRAILKPLTHTSVPTPNESISTGSLTPQRLEFTQTDNEQEEMVVKQPKMKLSAYIVRHDSGFSPNPFGRVCTLACCKPIIRRNAKEGDIVVGTGSAACGLEGRLIYAMLVKAVLPFESYWQRYPSKRPSSRTPVKRLGDNIWHRDSSGKWCCEPGAIHDERNQSRDISGHNALISDDFYYFGRDAIEIPRRFSGLIATTQGHVNSHDAFAISGFWKWIKANSPKPGRIGLPSDFAKPICECNQIEDE